MSRPLLFRLTPDELVYALRSAISARWPGRNEHGTPVAWRMDRARKSARGRSAWHETVQTQTD